MSISDTLKQGILEIPGDEGFWKSSSEDTFLEMAELLVEKGLSDDDITYVLSELYYATSACYGN